MQKHLRCEDTVRRQHDPEQENQLRGNLFRKRRHGWMHPADGDCRQHPPDQGKAWADPSLDMPAQQAVIPKTDAEHGFVKQVDQVLHPRTDQPAN